MNLQFINQELERRQFLSLALEDLINSNLKVTEDLTKRMRRGEVHALLAIANGDWKMVQLVNDKLVEMGAVLVRNRGRQFFKGIEVRGK